MINGIKTYYLKIAYLILLKLLDVLNPRIIIDGHTHHGCRKIHRDDILEVTIPSFSWRNKDNPSFLMVGIEC